MSLRAISPLDGRYARQVAELADHVSEWALIRARVRVEVEWLRALVAELGIDVALPEVDVDPERVKEIERTTNHDVKAVEYALREQVPAEVRELVHFALTSEDVNNVSYALMLRGAITEAWRPAAAELVDGVAALAEATRAAPLLSRTHGQPATPTTFGKEMAVFVLRWRRQLEQVDALEYRGKWNGAVGTYGAHLAAYPDVDWQAVSRRFVEGLGLTWSPVTTQIEPHDWIAELFHALARFNAILVDFDRDVWAYVSRGLVRQRPVAGEVGSSTMPHKVNPIDFENSEANAGVSSALALHMAQALPVSRLQRDLSDSSLLRNCGVVVGHSLLAVRSALRGLGKIDVDEGALAAELEDAWEVLAEAVQTVMRKRGGDDPYDQLKALTRGARIDRDRLREFVAAADLDEADRERLLSLTPAQYTGLAERLVDHLRG
ncbi:MAG: adenylosuccinate lyase [Actinomycetota bacterium]|nr:adenylosuccinate lyase [Actinomycetota bacterium]MDQ5808548.1 adenylosuccinate lyase [Actinomycetota bacterium]